MPAAAPQGHGLLVVGGGIVWTFICFWELLPKHKSCWELITLLLNTASKDWLVNSRDALSYGRSCYTTFTTPRFACTKNLKPCVDIVLASLWCWPVILEVSRRSLTHFIFSYRYVYLAAAATSFSCWIWRSRLYHELGRLRFKFIRLLGPATCQSSNFAIA